MDEAAVESHAAAAAEEMPPAKKQARQTDSLVDEAARVANNLNDKLPMISHEPRLPENQKAAPQLISTPGEPETFGEHALQPSERQENVRATEAAVLTTAATPQGETREMQETRGPMRRASASVGASVGENLRPRVEKLRGASTIVFDEAADDPGLRFVIVAVVLFVLFLFILLFSYILG